MIVKHAKLTDKQLKDMQELISICNIHDDIDCSLDIDESFRTPDSINTFLLYEEEKLLAFTDLFAPKTFEAELTAFTHPDYRRQRLFTRLLDDTMSELSRRRIPELLFVCNKESKDGQAVVRHLKAVHDFSEYSMFYNKNHEHSLRQVPGLLIRKSGPDDTKTLVRLSKLSFDELEDDARKYIETILSSKNRTQHVAIHAGEIAGMISTAIEGQKSYIHGLSVFPEYRKRGIGGALLDFKVVESLRNLPDHEIELEVMTENRGALSIYENAGFKVRACYDYFRTAVAKK